MKVKLVYNTDENGKETVYLVDARNKRRKITNLIISDIEFGREIAPITIKPFTALEYQSTDTKVTIKAEILSKKPFKTLALTFK